MTTAIAQQHTFEDVDDLIWDTCHKFIRRYGSNRIDLEEARAHANLTFAQQYHGWDPTKGTKFSTWLRFCIVNELTDKFRRDLNQRQRNTTVRMNTDVGYVPGEELSEDADTIIRWVLEQGDALVRNRPTRLKRIRQHFLEVELWWEEDVDSAFEEIAAHLTHSMPIRHKLEEIVLAE